MKTLEEEAQEFEDGNYMTATDKDVFIAGAKSKWVQAEKIKAQIEVLEATLKKYIDDNLSEFYIRGMISDLHQQLKQLEDESKT